MSTASGNMSKKISWYRSVCAKAENSERNKNNREAHVEPAKIIVNEKKPKASIIQKKPKDSE
jgi:transcription elongation GreA/GreB family factor